MTRRRWGGRRRSGTTVAELVLAVALLAGGCSGSADRQTTPPPGEAIRPGGQAVFAAEAEPTAGFNNRTPKGNTTGLRNVMRRVWPSVWITTPDFRTVLDTNVVQSVVEPEAGVAQPTIVYRINQAATWSDGVPISAADFIYNWEVERPGALDIDGLPINWVAPGEETIKNVTGSSDGWTVTVELTQPFAEWRSLFAKPLVPAHIAKKAGVGWNKGFDKFSPDVVISGGPYRIESYNAGADLTLVRNTEYWSTKANLDKVIFRFGATAPVALDALRNKGEIDVMAPRSQVDLLAQLRDVPGVTTLVGTGFEEEHLDFNLDNTLLKMPEVRRAFALALDRPAIVARTAGQIDKDAKVMQDFLLSAGDPNYPKGETGGSRYSKPDVVGATDLLKSAGFQLGADGIYAKDGNRLSFRLTAVTGDALRENQGELIKSQEKLAGIEILLDTIAPSALTDRITRGDFDIMSLLQGMATFPTTTSASFGTKGTVNISKYSSPAVVDPLYVAAKAELDDKKRADLLNQIDEQLWKDLPRIPLYQRPVMVAFRNTLANVGINPVSGPVWNIDQWGLKAPPAKS